MYFGRAIFLYERMISISILEIDDHDLLEYYLESLEIGVNYPEELELLD